MNNFFWLGCFSLCASSLSIAIEKDRKASKRELLEETKVTQKNRFNMLDINKDGFVSKAEFDSFGRVDHKVNLNKH